MDISNFWIWSPTSGKVLHLSRCRAKLLTVTFSAFILLKSIISTPKIVSDRTMKIFSNLDKILFSNIFLTGNKTRCCQENNC